MSQADELASTIEHGTELMDMIAENAEAIAAIAHDSNRDLTALAVTIWFMRNNNSTAFAQSAKTFVMASFYLGYQAGRQEGDLTIWKEKESGDE